MDVRALFDRNRERRNALYAGQDQYARYEGLAAAFRARFGREPETFISAPGRVELVGNHTDHQNGKVLAAAVNLDTVAAVAPRGDNRVVLYSEGFDGAFDVDLGDLSIHDDEEETTSQDWGTPRELTFSYIAFDGVVGSGARRDSAARRPRPQG